MNGYRPAQIPIDAIPTNPQESLTEFHIILRNFHLPNKSIRF